MNQPETTEIPEGWGRIYALADPKEPTVPKYIGRTTSTLKVRLWDHYGESKKKKHETKPVSAWVRELRSGGISPLIFTVETAPIENLNARENYWIVFYRPSSHLLNAHDGIGELGEPQKQNSKVKAITAPFLKAANEKRKRKIFDERGLVLDSLRQASKFLGVHQRRINQCVERGWKLNGSLWRFINNPAQPYEYDSV